MEFSTCFAMGSFTNLVQLALGWCAVMEDESSFMTGRLGSTIPMFVVSFILPTVVDIGDGVVTDVSSGLPTRRAAWIDLLFARVHIGPSRKTERSRHDPLTLDANTTVSYQCYGELNDITPISARSSMRNIYRSDLSMQCNTLHPRTPSPPQADPNLLSSPLAD